MSTDEPGTETPGDRAQITSAGANGPPGTETSSHLDWALAYAAIGFHVIPIWGVNSDGSCQCGSRHLTDPKDLGKHPIISDWSNGATTDADTITGWFTRHPTANVAILPGRSGHVCFDVDPRNKGHLTWEQLEPLPPTLFEESGGDHDGRRGQHFFFRLNGHQPRSIKNGVDVLVNKYVVVTPSVHSSGRRYGPINLGVETAELPETLRAGAQTSSGTSNPSTGSTNHDSASAHLRRALTEGTPDGERDQMLTDAAIALKGAGVPLQFAQETVAQVLGGMNHDENTVAKAAEKLRRIYANEDYESLPADLSRWAHDTTTAAKLASTLTPKDEAVRPGQIPPELEPKIVDRMISLKSEQIARERIAAESIPERVRRTAREYVTREPVEPVIDGVVGVGVNLVGGPTEAGKSLLARDWALHVAAGVPWRGHDVVRRRNVLFVAGEGMHDFAERWSSQPLWEAAADHVLVLDEPVNLLSAADVASLIDEYNADAPGLVVFDLIYDMGMADDNGVKDVSPVLGALNRIAAAWWAAVVAVGHPGHNGERRFRGSSMWRQRALTEFCLAEGTLSCEKSKLTDKRRLDATGGYRVEYPNLRWLATGEAVADAAMRRVTIETDLAQRPDDADAERARRLAPLLGVSPERARKLVAETKKDAANQ